MNIPFSPPDISEEEVEEVIDALKSGWITTGPKTKRLEKELLQLTGTNVGVCLNSQTAAAEMTLRVLGIGPGDEVITSAYTYTATASVVEHVGAKLVLVDTQEDSLEMDYDKVAELINENTKVIIPVDLAGIPCDYYKIFEIVEEKKNLFKANNDIQKAFDRIIVMADTAHALGAKYKGKKIGSVADFSNFSFHAVKNFTTAEGGYATWKDRDGINNEALYKQYQLLSLHGQSKDALNKTKLGSWEYDVMGPWYKCNMTDVLASIGLAQLRRYPELLKIRKSIIEKFDKNFRPLGVETLNHFDKNHESSGHLYITRIPGIDTESRNKIIEDMAQVGISCNVHYKPLPLLTAYKNLGFDIKDYPNAYKHYKNEITLPLHTKLTDEEVDYVIEKYCEIVKEYL
ncbi:DegT/DnrJ/EryC1/StrS aminotransferase family protein [Anaerococcus tetradius]|uniref:DegT/DnrJ/EryC1/StrS family aminotransferase n=1 Tax=Anaerococcus tetradius TaxID=33036 RepID=UPI0023F483E3|nr:DegT/DnrJ/EryC1/StrS family aminotransferase [Anaerococcus tetradius]